MCQLLPFHSFLYIFMPMNLYTSYVMVLLRMSGVVLRPPRFSVSFASSLNSWYFWHFSMAVYPWHFSMALSPWQFFFPFEKNFQKKQSTSRYPSNSKAHKHCGYYYPPALPVHDEDDDVVDPRQKKTRKRSSALPGTHRVQYNERLDYLPVWKLCNSAVIPQEVM